MRPMAPCHNVLDGRGGDMSRDNQVRDALAQSTKQLGKSTHTEHEVMRCPDPDTRNIASLDVAVPDHSHVSIVPTTHQCQHRPEAA